MRINKPLSIENGRERLEKLDVKYELLEWDGFTTHEAVFLDPEYGPFKAVFRYVVSEKVRHPERTKKIKSEASRKMNADPTHKEKIREGIDNYDKVAALEKRKTSMKAKYGSEYALQNDSLRIKAQQTMLDRYGQTSYAKTSEFKQAIKSFDMSRSIDGLKRAASKRRHVFSGTTMGEAAKQLGKAYTTFQSQVKKYGFEVALTITRKQTAIETMISSMLNELGLPHKKHERLGKYIADILLDDYNIAIEADGLFWHSDRILENKKYHLEKRKEYEKQGFRLLCFRSNEIIEKTPIVQSIIMNAVGKSERIYARKLRIDKVPRAEADAFMTNNHLMGPCSGVSYGLYDGLTLVACMTVKMRSGSLHIERFCNKITCSVIGGWGRLFSMVLKDKQPKTVVNFVDLRYGTGRFLSSMGFSIASEHIGFMWTNGNDVFHRMKFPNRSGYDVDLYKIWDCGQRKWIMQCSS